MISFESIHNICNRATPEHLMKYKLALCLHKLFNTDYNPIEFALLNFNQVNASRQTTFKTIKSNRTKIGINSLTNRLNVINNMIPLDWLNLSIETSKVKCKKLWM